MSKAEIFIGPISKIKRAQHHLINLERAEIAFFQTNNPQLVIDVDTKTGNKTVKVKLDVPVPVETVILSGEIIYHLRSALDQIAVGYARLSVAKPNTKNVYFPCGDSLPGFEASCKTNLAGFDQDLADQIIATKAYDGGDGNALLRAVTRMANIDKHMELIPAYSRGRLRGLTSFKAVGGQTGFLITGNMVPMNEGIVISELGPRGTFTPTHPNAQIGISGHITLGEVGSYNGQALVKFLKEMTAETARVVDGLVDFCKKTGRS